MKLLRNALLASVVTILSCTPQEAKDARDAAFTAADLACVFNSVALNEAALAKVCHFVDQFGNVRNEKELHNLIEIREAAKRSGVTWTPIDGGAAPAADPPDGEAP